MLRQYNIEQNIHNLDLTKNCLDMNLMDQNHGP